MPAVNSDFRRRGPRTRSTQAIEETPQSFGQVVPWPQCQGHAWWGEDMASVETFPPGLVNSSPLEKGMAQEGQGRLFQVQAQSMVPEQDLIY